MVPIYAVCQLYLNGEHKLCEINHIRIRKQINLYMPKVFIAPFLNLSIKLFLLLHFTI